MPPVIGITMDDEHARPGVHVLRDEYVRSVEQAGAIPVVLVPGTPAEAGPLLERLDGTKVEQFYRDEPLSQEQVSMKWDGEWHITYEVFRDLGAAFGAVLILIYILIIGWFGSFQTAQ